MHLDDDDERIEMRVVFPPPFFCANEKFLFSFSFLKKRRKKNLFFLNFCFVFLREEEEEEEEEILHIFFRV